MGIFMAHLMSCLCLLEDFLVLLLLFRAAVDLVFVLLMSDSSVSRLPFCNEIFG